MTWGILVTNYFLLWAYKFSVNSFNCCAHSGFSLWQSTQRNSVKREKSLAVQPVVGWLHCCAMVGVCGRTKFTSPNRQEAEIRQEESRDKRQSLSGMSQVTQSSSRAGLISFQNLPKQSHLLEIRPSARAFWDIPYSDLDGHQQLCFWFSVSYNRTLLQLSDYLRAKL